MKAVASNKSKAVIGRISLIVAILVAYYVLVQAATTNGDTAQASILPFFYLPPILINLLLAGFFGRTLLPGRTPLITQYSIRIRGHLEPQVVGYTRQVTKLWTLFFLLLAMESLALAVFAPLHIWSLFANALNYLFTALLFVGEYWYRRRHLSQLEHPDFLTFLVSLVSLHVSKTDRP